MSSQSVAGFLGAVVAVVVLAAAFIYGPSPSQIHNPAPAAAAQQPAPTAEAAPAAPAPKGPVIREVPNN